MGRPRKSETIDQKIDRLWTAEVKRSQGTREKPTAVRVWRLLHGNEWVDPSKSKQIVSRSYVEKRVRKIQSTAGKLPLFMPWQPWTALQETAEDRVFLLKLNAIKQAEAGLELLQHEAEWGCKLRCSLEGLSPYGQYQIVSTYAFRQFTATYLGGKQAYTADLDGLVAYRAWLPENQRPYELAVAAGLVPLPFFIPGEMPEPVFLEYALEHYPEAFAGWSTRTLDFLRPESKSAVYREQDEIKAQRLTRILQFWAGTHKTDESTQDEGVSDEREHS